MPRYSPSSSTPLVHPKKILLAMKDYKRTPLPSAAFINAALFAESSASATLHCSATSAFRAALLGSNVISKGSGLMIRSEFDLFKGTSISLLVLGLIFLFKLKAHTRPPQATTSSSWVRVWPRHWRWPQPNEVIPLMVGNFVSGSWKVGHPASSHRSGR